eukprot:364791-Chlamydomonas_euryale.AAC.7
MGTRRNTSAVVRVSCWRSRLDSTLPVAALNASRREMRISSGSGCGEGGGALAVGGGELKDEVVVVVVVGGPWSSEADLSEQNCRGGWRRRAIRTHTRTSRHTGKAHAS